MWLGLQRGLIEACWLTVSEQTQIQNEQHLRHNAEKQIEIERKKRKEVRRQKEELLRHRDVGSDTVCHRFNTIQTVAVIVECICCIGGKV